MALRDMLTESEAKTKWCPFGKVITSGESGYVVGNRVVGELPLCLASDCAFWRWSHQDHNGIPTGFCGGATLPKYL